MHNNQLATRWRALQGGFNGFIKKAKRLFVNPTTWRILIALLRAIYWLIRLLQQLL